MRFALINNELLEAKPGLKGVCPGCSEPVIARCGVQRIYHWAHSTKKTCDDWWESQFDFLGTSASDPQDLTRNTLWSLLPGRARQYAVVVAISRQDFIATTLKQPQLFKDLAHEFVTAFDKLLMEQEKMREYQQQKQRWKPSPRRVNIPERRGR